MDLKSDVEFWTSPVLFADRTLAIDPAHASTRQRSELTHELRIWNSAMLPLGWRCPTLDYCCSATIPWAALLLPREGLVRLRSAHTSRLKSRLSTA